MKPSGGSPLRHATKLLMGPGSARRVATFAAIASLALGLACTSPTLPLPPPAAPSVTVGSQPDSVHLASVQGSQPNALVLVINQNPDVPRTKRVTGTIADEQGSWELDVFGHVGDQLDVSQESSAGRSPPVTVFVK